MLFRSVGYSRVLEIGEKATVTLENIIITGGTTQGNGGGAFVEGTLIMGKNSLITNSMATKGSGVYVANTGSLTMEDGSIIGGNNVNGTMKTKTEGLGVYLTKGGKFYIRGKAKVQFPNDIFMDTGSLITVLEVATSELVGKITPKNYIVGETLIISSALESVHSKFKVTQEEKNGKITEFYIDNKGTLQRQ